MFTGIIEGLGKISHIRSTGKDKQLTIAADLAMDDMKPGDSVSVDGACLTVTSLDRRRFTVDVSPETLATTTLGGKRTGDAVNLERALRLSDRLDGHLVSGHIDGVGMLSGKRAAGNAVIISIKVPETLSRHIVQKGSIAVDGVSLTVNRCRQDSFEVSIVPHTARQTTISRLTAGDSVNIETDMLGKYVERFVSPRSQDKSEGDRGGSSVDLKLLAENGFL